MRMEFGDKFKVFTQCYTYNHAPYIENALEGFCIQQTTFPMLFGIFDDASTDETPEIISKFLKDNFKLAENDSLFFKETDDFKMVLAQHKTNENCFFAVLFMKYNHHQTNKSKWRYLIDWIENIKYFSLCEGDDYWIDSLKLQKQFDYLESHPDKSMVYTNCNVFFHEENVLKKDVFTTGYFKPTTNYKDFLLGGKYLAPCSWMYILKDYIKVEIPDFVTDGTLYKAFSLLVLNKVGYINDTTCTYRIVHGSASHSDDLNKRYKYLKGVFATERYLLEKYSDYFSKEDVYFLNNKRYQDLIPCAVAFNDKKILKEIKDFNVKIVGWKYKIMFLFRRIPVARYILFKLLCKSIKKGL